MCFWPEMPGLPDRYALAAGISTIAIISAVLGIAEWREGHVSGRSFCRVNRAVAGRRLLLSNRAPKMLRANTKG